MSKAYIGLGSNLDDPAAQVRQALAAIAVLDRVRLLVQSRLYRSPPMGPQDQPDYCNAVCVVESQLSAAELMSELLAIERRVGRLRAERWGPRRIDLDLLHMEGVSSNEPGLRLPHPGIAQRSFVLGPLAEVAPELVVPGVGAVRELAARIAPAELRPWAAA